MALEGLHVSLIRQVALDVGRTIYIYIDLWDERTSGDFWRVAAAEDFGRSVTGFMPRPPLLGIFSRSWEFGDRLEI